MSSRHLVLSYIEDYAAADVAAFVDTLRGSGYDGDVVFFTSNVTADCSALLKRYGVREIPVFRFDLKRKVRLPERLARGLGMESSVFVPDVTINARLSRFFHRYDLGQSPLARWVVRLLWHCNAGRFLYYQDFLEAHPHYEHVLLADVRDVMFQRPPFGPHLDDALYVYEEHPRLPLGQQADNAFWIRRLYGDDVRAALGDHPIVCAGVILGSHEQMLDCIRRINDGIVTNYIGWGTDQGILNYLVRTGALARVHVAPFGTGEAVHLGIAPRAAIRTSAEGQVRNAAGDTVAIVHQYDRHPDLADQLLASSAPVSGPVSAPAAA